MSKINLEEVWKLYAKAYSFFQPHSLIELHAEVGKYLEGRILDAGCGAGKLISSLASFDQYVGIDSNLYMLNEAKEKFGQINGIKFEEKNVENLDFGSDKFDSIVSINVLYSLRNPNQMLKDIFNTLNPGGVFCLASFNKNFDPRRMEAMIIEECGAQVVDSKSKNLFDDFLSCNKFLASQALDYIPSFYNLDEIVKLVRNEGFELNKCPSENWYGGQVFLTILQKPL